MYDRIEAVSTINAYKHIPSNQEAASLTVMQGPQKNQTKYSEPKGRSEKKNFPQKSTTPAFQ